MNQCANLCLLSALCMVAAGSAAPAADMLSAEELDRLALQRYWHARAPLPQGDTVDRAVLVDDNLYLLSSSNRAYAVHALTGVLRWSTPVAQPGQSVRGPSHSEHFAFFTGPASVRVLDRRTGDSVGEPRHLEGVVIETSHDIATISVGNAHGVKADDLFDVFELNEIPGVTGRRVAQVRVLATDQHRSKCRIIRPSRTTRVEAGSRVSADLVIPIMAVKLPFAASSPAVADDRNLYCGAANERIYSVEILSGVENWRVGTPKTVTAAPVVQGDVLFYAGQDGKVVACTSAGREKIWSFDTEGPIFLSPLVTDRFVYVASSDRQLYCLDRRDGRRVWRKRFDNPAESSPVLAGGRIYLSVVQDGLFALDAETGEQIWRRPMGGRFLTQIDRDVYLTQGDGGNAIIRVAADTGGIKNTAVPQNADHAVASPVDQMILLVSRSGEMTCLRPRTAPALKPEALAIVLQNDARAKALRTALATAAKPAEPEAKPAAAPEVDYLSGDDFFRSRSAARPAGGSGRALPAGEGNGDAARAKPAADEGDDSADEKAADEDEDGKDDDSEGDDSEDEESDDEDADDEESEDEEGDDEEDEDGEEDEGEDEEDAEDEEEEDEEGDDEEEDEEDEEQDDEAEDEDD